VDVRLVVVAAWAREIVDAPLEVRAAVWDVVAAVAVRDFDTGLVDARLLEILDLCAADVVVDSACARRGEATREAARRQASVAVFQ